MNVLCSVLVKDFFPGTIDLIEGDLGMQHALINAILVSSKVAKTGCGNSR